MYLHLGQDIVIQSSNIVAIFDIENTSISKITKDFLGNEQKNKRVVTVSSELPKSFIICQEQGKETVYISQISCSTLKKRSTYLQDLRLEPEQER